ncbi:hypothetical protein HPB50_014311 [Hyalomma asiaticum]|uniref:Uncharacterized protein n=1 Tax=Hyalomma asiaticum TaxID=266040 RepID=A0ACB7T4W0_HYAAI|nr:hypothetical protein HPB50_014311 [Hyalomma asiaticum]
MKSRPVEYPTLVAAAAHLRPGTRARCVRTSDSEENKRANVRGDASLSEGRITGAASTRSPLIHSQHDLIMRRSRCLASSVSPGGDGPLEPDWRRNSERALFGHAPLVAPPAEAGSAGGRDVISGVGFDGFPPTTSEADNSFPGPLGTLCCSRTRWEMRAKKKKSA